MGVVATFDTGPLVAILLSSVAILYTRLLPTMMLTFAVFVGLLSFASANVVELTWNLGWKWLAPDGFGRPIITVNGQWPAPLVRVKNGDRLIVHVQNNLGNETASIHWHGLLGIGANHMDGPAMVTQCPIPPGSSFTYDFVVRLPTCAVN